MREALHALAFEDGLRVFVITGEGSRAFSAGGDPKERNGMVNGVVEAGQALAAAVGIARRIAAAAPMSVRYAKLAASRGGEVDFHTGCMLDIAAYNGLVASADRREGVLAFNERRAPRWSNRRPRVCRQSASIAQPREAHLKPLAIVRVIEIGSIVSASYAGQLLADLGAMVVKVKPLAGDSTCNLGHAAHPDMAVLFLNCNCNCNCNRGKRSIAIDVSKAEGLAILERLVASADVFLHNMRFDSAERPSTDHAKLAEVHCRGQRATRGHAAQALARMFHRVVSGLALRDRITSPGPAPCRRRPLSLNVAAS